MTSSHRNHLTPLPVVLTSVASLCFAGAASAAEPPVLKSGLWEVVRMSAQEPGRKHVTTMCLDDSVQAEMREFGMGVAKSMCSQNERSLEGTRMVTTSVCKMGPQTITSKTVMTFKGNTAYHADGSATFDPPMANVRESNMSIDAKWTGPCKPGQKPGDMTLENGQTLNIKQQMGK
ncbi:MAG TPA: DUF3617 family protein [Casimicrobiaceae bacterium]|nr:DUF3617 family protein [Casimicrobiaceae bacterium]